MCRICSYYVKLDLEELPTSNPFIDDDDDMIPSPTDVEVPNTIIVETPELGQHTAWTNLRRFPSLYYASPPGPRQVQSTIKSPSRRISIYGPRQVVEFGRSSHVASDSYQQGRAVSSQAHTCDMISSPQRKLQRHDRVDSFPEAMTDDFVYSRSFPRSTAESTSSVSDEEEFSYLPSSTKVAKAYDPHAVTGSSSVEHSNTPVGRIIEPSRFENIR